MNKKRVGYRLRMAIEALGVTQVQAAQVMGVTPQKLRNWVSGDNYPDPLLLRLFCDRYNVTFDWLYRENLSGMASPLADVLWEAGRASPEVPAGAADPQLEHASPEPSPVKERPRKTRRTA